MVFEVLDAATRAPLWCASLGCCCVVSMGGITLAAWRQREHSRDRAKQRTSTCAGKDHMVCRSIVTTYCPDCREGFCEDCLVPAHSRNARVREHSNFVPVKRKESARMTDDQEQMQKLIDQELLDDLASQDPSEGSSRVH
eukprot:TRINITY_DN13119_c0_g1_i1.p1 TRINITY_DN13119_c0_g1~~TRINITY_DN13119_c0_g1_i1.p1  ORF type:complete len:140 (+),score=14.87 TRINITY_DN13119_c0_g1_i1:39-458(+)